MHDDACIGRRSENNTNASCMTISGGRTKQLDTFCRFTGFTSDFLSFIVVKLIRFFHGAIQLVFSSRCHYMTVAVTPIHLPRPTASLGFQCKPFIFLSTTSFRTVLSSYHIFLGLLSLWLLQHPK